MGSIPLPALDVRTPQQSDVLGQAQKITALKSLLQGQQLQQQQIQMGQFAIQDKDIVTRAFVKNNGDIDKTITDAAKAGATPQTLQQLQLHSLDMKTKAMGLVQQQGAIAVQQANLMQGAHDTVMKADPKDRPAVYQQQHAALAQAGIDVSQLPPQYPGDEQFKYMGAAIQGHTQQIEEAAKQAELLKTQAQTGEAAGKEAQARADAALKQQEAAMGGTGAMADSRYRNILQKQNLGQAVPPEDAAWANAYKSQKQIGPMAQIAVINATTKGNDAAVANVPAKQVPKAKEDFNKAGEDYAGAVQAGEDMKSFVDLARSGNKVAYAYSPTEGVLTLNSARGVKRVNMAEIHSYSGAGSLVDRIQGFLGKQISGASLPPDILNDMEQLHTQITGNAKSAYSNKVKIINKTYQSSFEPVDLSPQTAAPAADEFDWAKMPPHK